MMRMEGRDKKCSYGGMVELLYFKEDEGPAAANLATKLSLILDTGT